MNNREIKFRAWDKTNNRWYMDGDSFDLNYSGKQGDIFFDNDHPTNMRNVELEWVQYTGLKDKNGKEIYEGDIIRCSATQREINHELEDDIVKVAYGNGYFYPFGYNCGWRSEVFDIELLGNIYENPELLK